MPQSTTNSRVPVKTKKRKTQPTKVEKRISDEIIEKSVATGLLPHEILLNVARGNSVKVRKLIIVKYRVGPNKGEEKSREWVEEDYYPSFQEQMECARAAAPFFAPRLATQTVKTDEATTDALTEVMKQLAGKLPG